MKKKGVGYWLFMFLFLLVAVEILLRIYNPFPSSVVGDKIILTPNYSKIYENKKIHGDVDETIIYKRNGIGLRGPQPPSSFKDHLTIIAIGGSTTECMYISEGKTWEDLLGKKLAKDFPGSWVNNAGFVGHSTFGHIILLRDYIIALKPKICLFLVGVNDIDRTDLLPYESNFTKTNQRWLLTLAKKSALVNVLLNLYRNHLAGEKKLPDGEGFSLLNKKPLRLPDSVIQHQLQLQQLLLASYDSRLQEMIRLCKLNHIEPIFLTQPCLAGETIDSLTGVNLSTFPVKKDMNGNLFSKYMDLYNAETEKVAERDSLFLIDLAHQLPKSSAYFYDLIHFNNTGSNKVAELVAEDLNPYLKKKYAQFYTGK